MKEWTHSDRFDSPITVSFNKFLIWLINWIIHSCASVLGIWNECPAWGRAGHRADALWWMRWHNSVWVRCRDWGQLSYRRKQLPVDYQLLRQDLVLGGGAVLGQSSSFTWSVGQMAFKGVFSSRQVFALQQRGGRSLPLEFLEVWVRWAADSPLVPMVVLTGPISVGLIHWEALTKARYVWGPLPPLSPTPRSVKQQWASGFWSGLLSTAQALWGYVAGVKVFIELICSCLSPAETLWLQLSFKHCLHRGERVLWALLLLWHERYVACVREVTFPSLGFYTHWPGVPLYVVLAVFRSKLVFWDADVSSMF